jgi:NAD+ synthase (glutamine-hydrolysing)
MDFHSLYAHGFARIAACTVPITVADPATNVQAVLAQARECHDEGVAVALFPELCLSGYAIDDLFLQEVLLDSVEDALATLVEESRDLRSVLVVGAPLRHLHRVYNCAVVVHRGAVLGVAPKAFLPNYREFYEKRWFAGGPVADDRIRIFGTDVPFGVDVLYEFTDVPGLVLHAEICEDMWVPVPPSANAALAGATVLLNLSGSPITVGRAEDRRLLVRSSSQRCLAAHAYAAGGEGESSTDLAWDGQTMVYECGDLLGETERFPQGARRTVVDVDLRRIAQERLHQGSFDDNAVGEGVQPHAYARVPVAFDPPEGDLGLRRKVDRFPFVPDDPARLALDCFEACSRPTTSRWPASSSGCVRSAAPRS